MVLERYLTDVLASHFGHFVEGLDKNQIRLSALWKGQVSLQNVRLRRHALDHLVPDSPIEIAHGHVGTLQLHIPWQIVMQLWQGSKQASGKNTVKVSNKKQETTVVKQKKAGSVSLVLKDVHVLIIPRRNGSQVDLVESLVEKGSERHTAEAKEEKDAEEDATDPCVVKEAEIQAALDAELLRMATTYSNPANQQNSKEKQSPSDRRSWQSWLQERLAAILENLTVTVQNVHVRYEDSGSCLGFVHHHDESLSIERPLSSQHKKKYRPSFCVGLTLKEFAIHSIQRPSSDAPGAVENQSTPAIEYITRYKQAAASDLALYWNSGTRNMSELQEIEGGEEFYEEVFLAFQNGGQPSDKNILSEKALADLFGLFPKNESMYTYVLDPFSPSITFAVVHPTSRRVGKTPPSTIEARLPPCRFTVSRNLIEDLGYLRNSVAIWAQSRRYEHLAPIIEMRPSESVHQNPSAWWRYAGHAIVAIQQGEKKQKTRQPKASQQLQLENTSGFPSEPGPHNRRGWHALSHAIILRRQYVDLYQKFASEDENEYFHLQLLHMEQEDLTIAEVATFRIHAARKMPRLPLLSPLKRKTSREQNDGGDESSVVSALTVDTALDTVTDGVIQEKEDSSILTAEHRYRMLKEIKQALAVAEGGKLSGDEDDDSSSAALSKSTVQQHFGLDNSQNLVAWTTYISCSEVSMQINDKRIQRRHRDVPAPVVQLLFAFLQEQRLLLDGSWELAVSVGSLRVKDCTSSAAKNPFPYMLGPKNSAHSDSFQLDGVEHLRSGSLRVRRSQRGFRTDEFGSTTWTEIRVLPLELCYFTSPVEALVRILNTANLDFANDYQKLGAKLYEWRERQRKRLLAALSHKQKSIYVQVDVGSPTLLLPDDEGSLLIVDLGQLRFCNDDLKRQKAQVIYDDHWKLELTSIQVQCASVELYKWLATNTRNLHKDREMERENRPTRNDSIQQLIEPFSLIFGISTKFHEEKGERTDFIRIKATLPRLAFNMTSSAVRLVRRLREQWDERQQEIRSSMLLPSRVLGGLAGKAPDPPVPFSHAVTRKVEFVFSAPLLRFKCENDVDGRDCNVNNNSTTPLVDLAFRGIEGSWKSASFPSGRHTVVSEAKLRGVDCVDLYQGAGEEFSLLLSSVAPELIYDARNLPGDQYTNISTDLVSVTFESTNSPFWINNQTSAQLKIRFHELFVEWNAESIAAIFKAISKPVAATKNVQRDSDSEMSELFFDAEEEEDDFHDAGSVLSGSDSSFDLSEVASSRPPSTADLVGLAGGTSSLVLGSAGLFQGSRLSLFTQPLHSDSPPSQPKKTSRTPFELTFDLSKLRVSFNKESRHRKVVSAEMDRTSMVYSSLPTGGYIAKVTLGNFTLSDSDSTENKTLYREIVGLKTDVPQDGGNPASLLEMSITKNPRSRTFAPGESTDGTVFIDVDNASSQGCDVSFSARFSPMRFVYLQQLWFEVIDYFFEGIVGFEVWGNKRPQAIPESKLKFAPYNADEFSFTRFDIELDAPVILIPVSYCSTDFVRVKTSRISVANRYDFRTMRSEAETTDSGHLKRLQWYNNCAISVGDLDISSWSGRRLNLSDEPFTAQIEMNWPSGPTALLNKPKWEVSCHIDETHMALLREDYALLQNIISSNFGEGSRHWDEWDALQNLPPLVLERYKEDIMVHFGYDKKDVTPTTFDVSLTLPCLAISLLEVDRSETALIHCFDLRWKYWKVSDLISRQHVTCQIDMARKESESYVGLLTGQGVVLDGGQCEGTRPSLSYKSINDPAGGMEKSLEIEHALVRVGYRPWYTISSFFSDLPLPKFISPSDVIQVGDRWYKIGGGSSLPQKKKQTRTMGWIVTKKLRNDVPLQQRHASLTNRSSSFRLILRCPQIAVESENAALVLSMDRGLYSSFEQFAQVERNCKTEGLKLTTLVDRKRRGQTSTLLELNTLNAKMRQCSAGHRCDCLSHSTNVDMGQIMSTATFSDLNVACEVLLKLAYDMRLCGSDTSKKGTPKKAQVPPLGLGCESLMQVCCTSVSVVVTDDSRRHFATSQELLNIEAGTILFHRRFAVADPTSDPSSLDDSMELSIQTLKFVDCLQSDTSPFREVLSISPVQDTSNPSSFMFGASPPINSVVLKKKIKDQRCCYDAELYKLEMQYNPSMVIALQRLLGRLRKRVTTAYRRFPPLRNQPTSNQLPVPDLYFVGRLGQFSLQLNKEHRGRCLVHLLVDNIACRCSKLAGTLLTKVRVEDLNIFDSRKTEGLFNRNDHILRVSDASRPFLEVNYISNAKGNGDSDDENSIPDWAVPIVQDNEVDDVLNVSLASLDFVFISERTFELVDYLKNALPGKNLGYPSVRGPLTSISRRKNPRKLFRFQTEVGALFIPRCQDAETGLMISSELLLRSWTAQDPAMELEGSLTNFVFRMYQYDENGERILGNKLVEDIEMLLHVEKTSGGRTEAKCGISDIQARLCYTDFVCLAQLTRENVGKTIDKSLWDNYEWYSDDADLSSSEIDSKQISKNDQTFSKEVAYGPGARYVRFGTSSGNKAGSPFELTVALLNASLVLRRDDSIQEGIQLDYDMVLFKIENSDFVYSSTPEEGASAVFSVKRVFAFDLGLRGRVLRKGAAYNSLEGIGDMPVAILAEGYNSSEETSGPLQNEDDTLILVRWDQSCDDFSETRISVVFNRLSFAALFRPLKELIEFANQSWSSTEQKSQSSQQYQQEPSETDELSEVAESEKMAKSSRPVAIRLVLHYPRIMFVADEADPHSRALILRGLALVSARLSRPPEAESGTLLTEVTGDFQNISSYILPDVSDILYAKDSLRFHVEDVLDDTSSLMFLEDHEKDRRSEEPGIALLLPVTMGVELEQRSMGSEPRQRSLSLNMDPLSVMISADDLQLIRLLAKKWSAPSGRDLKDQNMYDVVFRAQVLGIGLRKVEDRIIVDAVHHQSIGIGDSLVAINDDWLRLSESTPLSDIVEKLRNEPRPLKLTFALPNEHSMDSTLRKTISPGNLLRNFTESVDISLAKASLTLIGNEVPILRAEIFTTRLNVIRKDDSTLERQLKLSSVMTVDYYNLRIWNWEPFLESGTVRVLADLKDPKEGTSKTLTVELSDAAAATPISFNLTNAAASAFSKLLNWDTSPDDDTDGLGFIDEAKKAANAALRFAQQQKNSGSKPFLLQNQSGISCAFVVQKKNVNQSTSNPGVSNTRASFVTVGDYSGLHNYDPSDISEIPAGGDCKFRLDRGAGSRRKDGQGRAPCLTVALQSVSGTTLEPLVDLQIVRSGVTLLPLTCTSESHPKPFHIWVSWTVIPKDEMTILQLSSTFRIVSLLHTPLELGLVATDKEKLSKNLGVLPVNADFYLPLWLCLHSSFDLSIRPAGGRNFSPLFTFSEKESTAKTDRKHQVRYVECASREGGPMWLAASKDGDATATSITIDCVLTLLNMLPEGIEWEVSKSRLPEDEPIDGSTLRRAQLNSGEEAEILGADDIDIFVRVKRGKKHKWSPWLALETGETRTRINHHRIIRLADIFGVPLDIGARVTRRTVGFRVTLFAELWFLNTTSLNISFGVSGDSMLAPDIQKEAPKDDGQSEVSAAEAALKEISSLFETGDAGRNIKNQRNQNVRANSMLLLPSNGGPGIVEECFEYIEVDGSMVIRRWWATEDPLSTTSNLTLIEDDGENWFWTDSSWLVDPSGDTREGWESASHIFSFSPKREFHSAHRYRRRRWFRRRTGLKTHVDAFFHRPYAHKSESDESEKKEKDKSRKRRNALQLGIQVNGGEWSLMSQIPAEGVLFGAIKATSCRWKDAVNRPYATYELCYNVSPLEGDFGEVSRLMAFSSRFIVRNDSKNLLFAVKQAGTSDSTSILVPIGGTEPFHWTDHRLPELICVRPMVEKNGSDYYRWSGGFDPLSIGVIPLRIRKISPGHSSDSYDTRVRSLKMESKIRPGTGRTGINISFEEEDDRADGSLFRVDNRSLFPLWISQDGILANPSTLTSRGSESAGDFLPANETISFALDVPFRQGKKKNRKAATLEELLRIRISLAPLNTRSGIESVRVVSLSGIGATVRLNPAKLPVLDQRSRNALQQIRIVGVVTNDGPTRVLRCVMMRKEESLFSNPFSDDSSVGALEGQAGSEQSIEEAAILEGSIGTIEAFAKDTETFPLQEDAMRMAMNAFAANSKNKISARNLDNSAVDPEDDDKGLVISFRMSFNGFIFSLVDSSPGEIAVVALRNVNALASWNTNRTFDSTVYVTVSHFQVDNMLPNSPHPVAISPDEHARDDDDSGTSTSEESTPPLLVLGLSFAPRHKSGISILKSVTVAPRNVCIRVDLAFLVRLQKYVVDMQRHFSKDDDKGDQIVFPDLKKIEEDIRNASLSGVNSQRFYFGGLTILPCTIKLSVAPARALSAQQAMLEGEDSAAIHRAVRKGDVRLGDSEAILGVKIGSRNATPLAVMRGVVKSIVVDALLRLDGASLTFAGVSLQNHIATGPQLGSILAAHYVASLRHNVPALVGSMSALGNPVGLVRGLGDGVSDFVLEPVKGFQRSVQEMDASHLVDGVARGTLSLARHTVGGFADSAAALAETFSKNMTVLTLDRRYAQKRDRGENLRELNDLNVALGLGSGVQKLVHGFVEGVTGVVKAPMRGAEKRGVEGFAKGIGKGLLGLLVKPIIGISDGITDVMIGVKGAMDGAVNIPTINQIRPRRALYGRERAIRPYSMADAAASALMMRTRLAGEIYMSHIDMGDRVALFSVKRILMLGPSGQELLVLKYKHIESLEIRSITLADGSDGWGIIIILNTPRRNGSEVEVINCQSHEMAQEMCAQIDEGMRLVSSDLEILAETDVSDDSGSRV